LASTNGKYKITGRAEGRTTENGKPETGNGKLETGNRELETGNRKQAFFDDTRFTQFLNVLR